MLGLMNAGSTGRVQNGPLNTISVNLSAPAFSSAENVMQRDREVFDAIIVEVARSSEGMVIG